MVVFKHDLLSNSNIQISIQKMREKKKLSKYDENYGSLSWLKLTSMWKLSLTYLSNMDNMGSIVEISSKKHGREFESHQVRRFSYGSDHSSDNSAFA